MVGDAASFPALVTPDFVADVTVTGPSANVDAVGEPLEVEARFRLTADDFTGVEDGLCEADGDGALIPVDS